ncbi:MAG: pyridoxal 5'-phosphate synthase glutaminase subunit PdxT [Acidobacteria bacterium]|nr:MAG: pyridoxal 5'-phosphate synthase glutaminase subunit PdxT [Acidobacteriota bacterium]
MAVGVLALQGDFAAHAAVLRRLGESVLEVRSWTDLAGLRALVLPGGESTALLRLMDGGPWFDALRAFHGGGGGLLGTCAGAILLARDVDPAQPSLGLLDVSISRNAYGRQVDSFEAELDASALDDPLLGVFIRAPRFTAIGPQVHVLARRGGEPVLVRQRRVLAATFHPEIAGDDRVHRMLIEISAGTAPAG